MAALIGGGSRGGGGRERGGLVAGWILNVIGVMSSAACTTACAWCCMSSLAARRRVRFLRGWSVVCKRRSPQPLSWAERGLSPIHAAESTAAHRRLGGRRRLLRLPTWRSEREVQAGVNLKAIGAGVALEEIGVGDVIPAQPGEQSRIFFLAYQRAEAHAGLGSEGEA